MNAAIAFGTGLLFFAWAVQAVDQAESNLVVWVLAVLGMVFCVPVTLLQLADDLRITARRRREE